MKKLFMMAATAALAIGVSSCTKNPGNDPDNPGGGTGDGTASGMQLNLVLPAGSGGNTRALTDFIPGTQDESRVNSVHVFIFENTTNALKVATGGYTTIPKADLATYYDFSAGTVHPTNGTVSYPMRANQVIPTVVGRVKVYVAFNLPTDLVTTLNSSDGYTDEAAMLAGLSRVTGTAAETSLIDADAAGADNGFVMFSEASLQEFVAVPPDGVIPTQNKVSIEVSRVASKALATFSATKFPNNVGMVVPWTLDLANEDDETTSGVQLTYEINHWFIFQDVVESYLAPRHDIDSYITYLKDPVTAPTGVYKNDANVFSYDKSIARTKGGERGYSTITNFNDEEDTGWEGTAATMMYIGENVTRGIEAMPENTTVAWISARVIANAKAVWSSATPRTSGKIKWVNASYGAAPLTNDWLTDTGASDIWMLRVAGKNYITQQADIADIKTGILYTGARTRNRRLMDHLSFPMSIVINGTPTPFANFAAWVSAGEPDDESLQGTDMSEASFKAAFPEYIPEEFVYTKGYVHFPYYINMVNSRAHLNRNQLIHLSVDDFKSGVTGSYKFPGYPGQKEIENSAVVMYPLEVDHPDYDNDSSSPDYNITPWGSTTKTAGSARVPISVFATDNNPQIVTPGTPIVPASTQITVSVSMRPWAYKKQEIQLQF